MAYDEVLAGRIRDRIGQEPGVTERKMFGGLAFLAGGHMAISASGQGGLLVHVPPDDTDALLDPPQVDRAVMGGRPMNGWLRVTPDEVAEDADLLAWIERGLAFARSQPPK